MLRYIATAVLYEILSIEYKSEKIQMVIRLFLVVAQDKMGSQVEKKYTLLDD